MPVSSTPNLPMNEFEQDLDKLDSAQFMRKYTKPKMWLQCKMLVQAMRRHCDSLTLTPPEETCDFNPEAWRGSDPAFRNITGPERTYHAVGESDPVWTQIHVKKRDLIEALKFVHGCEIIDRRMAEGAEMRADQSEELLQVERRKVRLLERMLLNHREAMRLVLEVPDPDQAPEEPNDG